LGEQIDVGKSFVRQSQQQPRVKLALRERLKIARQFREVVFAHVDRREFRQVARKFFARGKQRPSHEPLRDWGAT